MRILLYVSTKREMRLPIRTDTGRSSAAPGCLIVTPGAGIPLEICCNVERVAWSIVPEAGGAQSAPATDNYPVIYQGSEWFHRGSTPMFWRSESGIRFILLEAGAGDPEPVLGRV